MEKLDYIPEKYLEGLPTSTSINSLKRIIELTEKCICKIKCNDGGHGTGFFCNIYLDDWNFVRALITNYHVLNKNDISNDKKIEFSTNNEKENFNLVIDETRKIFTNEIYDITIIEINENDGLKRDSYLEIDNTIYDNDKMKNLEKLSIFLLHYPKEKGMEFSKNIIQSIDEYSNNIQHLCDSDIGSSGGPLINSINYKVIGIHKGGAKTQNYDVGTLLKGPIEEFKKTFKNENKVIKTKLRGPKRQEQKEQRIMDIHEFKEEGEVFANCIREKDKDEEKILDIDVPKRGKCGCSIF